MGPFHYTPEYYTYSMNKEQYKTYLRQRLNEEDINHNVIAQYGSQDPVPRLLARPDLSPDSQEVIAKKHSNGGPIANHPYGVLTRVLARHLDVGASKVFQNTRHLTTDSSHKNVDNAIGDAIDQHGDKVDSLWLKLSAEPGDPYHTPPGNPDRDYDAVEARSTASHKQFVRFIDDFTQHIHDNVSTGDHTEFTGTPRYDGV